MTPTTTRLLRPLARAAALAFLAAGVALPALGQADDSEIQRLMKDKQYPQALKAIDDYLAKKPDDPRMRFRKGVVLSYMDRSGDALKVFQKLAEDHPDMPAPHNNIAVLLAARGDYERARGALESAIRTNPAYATAYQNLGDVYARLASQAYTKALQLDKADTSLPPKLALLRELTTEPAATTALAAAPAPTAPAPAPAAVTAKPATTPPAPTVVAAAPAAPTAPATTAAAKPAAAPMPAPAPTAAPAPVSKPTAASAPPAAAPTPPKPAVNEVADVNKAVQAWAQAWSRRDMNDYFAAYAPDYTVPGKARKAWEEDRRARIATRNRIKVEVADLRITVEGNKATARFRQIYESDTLSTSGRKSLDLVKDNAGRWVIRQESVGQ